MGEYYERLLRARRRGEIELADPKAARVFLHLATKILEEPSLKIKRPFSDLRANHYHVLIYSASRALGIPLEEVRAGHLLYLLSVAGISAFVADLASADGVRNAVRRIRGRKDVEAAYLRILEELERQHSRSSSS